MPRFSETSIERLRTLDAVWQEILLDAIEIFDFTVVCGYRPDSVQEELYAQGRTTPGKIVTYKRPGQSIHNHLPSRAVDLAPYRNGGIAWDDINLFYQLAGIIQGIAHKYGVAVRWGGDWEMRDFPHFELT